MAQRHAEEHNSITFPFVCVCKRPLFFSCLNVSFSFPKRVVFFNAVNIICATEIPFLSYLAGPQCRCSSGLKDCANFFYIYKVIVVFE